MDAFSVGLLLIAALCYVASWLVVYRWLRVGTDWVRPLLVLLLGPVFAFFAMIAFVFLFWPPRAWVFF